MEDKPASDHVPMARLDRPPRGALATLGLFLLGNGEAIRRLAATPRLWLVGLLFTFGAGLAREYDAEDLLAEPWHLLIAPGASWMAATALWLLVQFNDRKRWVWSSAKAQNPSTQPDTESGPEAPPITPPRAPRLLDSYLAFLGLFWLTAPLAWMYGIPFERFQSAGEAASSNLWMLTVIALWRGVLMIRVLHVLYGIGGVVASVIVLLFGDVLMLIALTTIPVPIFAIMGGVRLGEADRSLAMLALVGKFLSAIGAVVLLGLLWVTTSLDKRRWSWHVAAVTVPLRPLVILALVAIAWWCAWLPLTQPEQQLRHQVEQALRQNDFATGLSVLASHEPERFPPHWDPPPRIGYADNRPDPGDVLLFLLDHPHGERCQRIFEDKLIAQGWIYAMHLRRNRTALSNLVTLLERMPNAERLMHPTFPEHDRDRYGYGLHQALSQVGDSGDPALGQRINTLLERYPLR